MNLNPNEWADAERIANLPAVHEVIQGFAEDPTGDSGTMIVREVLRALVAATAPIVAQPVVADDWKLFREWAEAHLGQGYSLESEEGVYTDEVTRWCFNGFKAGLRAQQPVLAIPPNWQYVPKEPTEDMVVAFAEVWYSKSRCYDDPEMDDAYAALLAAAPAAPTDGEA